MSCGRPEQFAMARLSANGSPGETIAGLTSRETVAHGSAIKGVLSANSISSPKTDTLRLFVM
jgi:hypothetical protein